MQEELDEVVEVAEQALRLDPSNASLSAIADAATYNATSYLLNDLRQRKEHFAADREFQRGIDRFPDNLWLLTSYADFLTDEFPRYSHAEALLDRALELSPTDADASAARARWLYKVQGAYDRAALVLETALAIHPAHLRSLVISTCPTTVA
ncbi:hypothetical protein T484DRAFT_1786597 [Baffinella frigidus]|nr:hypothetical protein T484DRAFT_1786597 [Cryptophyta sp. CCMP2293]